MATLIRLLSAYLLLLSLVVSCWLNNVHALDTRKARKNQYYCTLQISSLFPDAYVCNPSTKGSNNRKASIKVFNRHGPCSSQDKPNEQPQPQPQPQPSMAEILSHDQSRVNSIQARLAFSSDMLTNDKLRDKKTSLPAQPGISLGAFNYFVTIGIGTPEKQLSLIFDTGSDLTWTQCQPCAIVCYNQKQEIFDPSKSSTYDNITCSSPLCSQLKSPTGTPRCAGTTCVYGIQYGDQSFTIGYFAKERVTLTPTDVLDNFLFGCGQNNGGLFRGTAGLIGLGRDPLSIVSQTAAKYKRFFSYCLPSSTGSGGHLTFGNNGVPKTVKYTPFADSKGTSFYVLTIAAISVGGRQLPISSSVLNNPGTIIDSGTVVTRLPTPVYKPLRDAFRQQMTMYKMVQPTKLLDTCYDLSNYTSVKIPTISFYFSGNVKVDIVPNGILLVANGASQMCLAFAETDSLSIFGNLQQQTLEVVYDVAEGKLGFSPNGCT